MAAESLESFHLPVIDISEEQQEVATATQVRAACIDSGFFCITNHGISSDLLTRVYKLSKAFFAMPIEVKETILVRDSRGWTPLAEETLDPTNQKRGDTKEGIYIGREPEADELGLPLRAENIWPDENQNPSLQGYKETMLEYHSAMTALGLRMLRLISLALQLPSPEHFHKHFTRPLNVLRLLRYSNEVSSPGDGVIGCGAHTDYGMLTFLSTDDVPGLEVYTDGSWKAVPVRPDDFIVNIGDMLERWSNGLFKSTLHRVVNREGRERFSIPFFFEPNFDTLVEVLQQCISDDRPAKHKPITSGEFVLEKYKETHAMFDEKNKEN
eukprot:m.113569 g.113569  ORF g.113569 m.113569 type:complete len:326 (+) comp14136_c0_seq4:155-1132(+)